MAEKKEKVRDPLMDLVRELTLRKHGFQLREALAFFKNMSIGEYLALSVIRSISENPSVYEGKTYLKDLSEYLGLSIARTSDLVKGLNRRGLLVWDHDGDGSSGTYVVLTDTGRKYLELQEVMLKQFYRKVIENYGQKNLTKLLEMVNQLDDVIGGELERMGGGVECQDNSV